MTGLNIIARVLFLLLFCVSLWNAGASVNLGDICGTIYYSMLMLIAVLFDMRK